MAGQRASFIHGGTAPPTGYVYAVEHEGQNYVFQSPTRLGLMQQLQKWYSAKGLAWPGEKEMTARVEDFICARCPPGFCKGGSDRKRTPFFSVSGIRDVTKLIMRRTFSGEAMMVPAEEAERRARICADCPNNLHGICTSCLGNEFQDIFRWLISRNRKTSFDGVLDTCSVCKCLLKAKVHISVDELAKMEKHTFPANCWLHDTPCHVPDGGGETITGGVEP